MTASTASASTVSGSGIEFFRNFVRKRSRGEQQHSAAAPLLTDRGATPVAEISEVRSPPPPPSVATTEVSGSGLRFLRNFLRRAEGDGDPDRGERSHNGNFGIMSSSLTDEEYDDDEDAETFLWVGEEDEDCYTYNDQDHEDNAHPPSLGTTVAELLNETFDSEDESELKNLDWDRDETCSSSYYYSSYFSSSPPRPPSSSKASSSSSSSFLSSPRPSPSFKLRLIDCVDREAEEEEESYWQDDKLEKSEEGEGEEENAKLFPPEGCSSSSSSSSSSSLGKGGGECFPSLPPPPRSTEECNFWAANVKGAAGGGKEEEEEVNARENCALGAASREDTTFLSSKRRSLIGDDDDGSSASGNAGTTGLSWAWILASASSSSSSVAKEETRTARLADCWRRRIEDTVSIRKSPVLKKTTVFHRSVSDGGDPSPSSCSFGPWHPAASSSSSSSCQIRARRFVEATREAADEVARKRHSAGEIAGMGWC